MNFVQFFHEFLAPLFEPLHTWSRWLVIAKAAYGLPLSKDEFDVFQEHTGRSRVLPGGYPEIVFISGRQCGKTRFLDAILSFESLRAKRKPGHPPVYCTLVAQDLRGVTRNSFSYISEAFDAIPSLKRSVVSRKAESLELENGCIVACYPCRPQALRGIRSAVVCLDELAFFRTSEGFPTDVEMLRAVRPSLATTGGKLFVASSPYGQFGALSSLHRQHFGQDDSPTLVVQATAAQMNPTLPEDYLKRMELEDPEAYRSEVLGEFRSGLSMLLDPELVHQCVPSDRPRELPPNPSVKHFAFVDPSGGRADAFGLAIGHREDKRTIVDVARRWPAPFNPQSVVAEMAPLLHEYRINQITSDRYGGAWVTDAFESVGIRVAPSTKSASELHLGLVPAVNSQRLELPNEPTLLRELCGLERRTSRSGVDRVDHRPGAHDDLAVCVSGLIGGVGFVRAPGDLGIS